MLLYINFMYRYFRYIPYIVTIPMYVRSTENTNANVIRSTGNGRVPLSSLFYHRSTYRTIQFINFYHSVLRLLVRVRVRVGSRRTTMRRTFYVISENVEGINQDLNRHDRIRQSPIKDLMMDSFQGWFGIVKYNALRHQRAWFYLEWVTTD
jgi:hypothetical protein